MAPAQSMSPMPAQIRAARKAAGLTQTEAGRLVHVGLRGWQEWEAGNRQMHPGLWELFQIKSTAVLGARAAGDPDRSPSEIAGPRNHN